MIHEIVADLEKSADYARRRGEIRAWNAQSPVLKRGIALTPVKFGISFTATHLNQAGCLLHVYTDGTILLNHGGTEMGQGLFIKVAQVVAEELQVDVDRIRITASDTSKVPNASPTAASSGSDMNGKAAQAAAQEIKRRLSEFAAKHLDAAPETIAFRANRVHAGDRSISFNELVKLAYFARVSLSATGFYRTPKISYDRKTWSGMPFFYFCYGAAVSEVVIDTLTGENRLLRVDILHDVGRSLNPAVDMGQIEGGFIQGVGWLTMEELWWNDKGKLMTHAPSTYKIPVASDVPAEFNVRIYESGINAEDSIHRSKAVGEPPLMLGISVLHAIRDAIAATADNSLSPKLDAPRPPGVLMSPRSSRARRGDACDAIVTKPLHEVPTSERLARRPSRRFRRPDVMQAAVIGQRRCRARLAWRRGRQAGTTWRRHARARGRHGGGHLEFQAARDLVAGDGAERLRAFRGRQPLMLRRRRHAAVRRSLATWPDRQDVGAARCRRARVTRSRRLAGTPLPAGSSRDGSALAADAPVRRPRVLGGAVASRCCAWPTTRTHPAYFRSGPSGRFCHRAVGAGHVKRSYMLAI